MASVGGKTKETLVLKDMLELLPDVTFYWAGDNPYAGDIMGELESTPTSGINIVALAALVDKVFNIAVSLRFHCFFQFVN